MNTTSPTQAAPNDDEFGDLSIAVVIPCLNEEVAVATVINDFRTALPSARIYVYDNASTDNLPGLEILGRAGHRVRRAVIERDAPMFEEFLPKRKLGVLTPLAVAENGPFEFYRMAPPGVMMVMVPCGLKEFSRKDVERVFAPLDALVDSLVQRQVDIIISSGVPLSLLMGIEAHDAFLARIAARSGKPAGSTLTAAIAAARHLGIGKIAFVNKWDDAMNATLAAFFARDGIEATGMATEVLPLDRFQGMASADSMDLAYALGRRALEEFPEADGLFISGGTWLAQPVCERLEREFGKPCLGNQACALWDALHKVDYWTPIEGHGMLLASG